MEISMNKGILFDLDGTLIDTSGDLAGAVNLMRVHFGYPALPVNEVMGFVGDGMHKLIARSIADTDIDFDEAITVNKKMYSENLTVKTTFYQGTLELLRFLKEQEIPVAITSNKPTDWCIQIAKNLGFYDYVSAIYGGSDSYALKPSPDMLILAAEALDIDLTQSIMVGDNWTDIDSGKAVGCKTAYFSQGFGEVGEHKPDFEYSEISSLKEWLIKALA